MSIGGNPKICPKPCPSVFYNVNPIETFGSQIDVTIPYKEKVQPVESQKILEVESNKLKMPDIDPFENDYSLEFLYGKMNQETCHIMREGNVQIDTSLFSDMGFLNEDWNKYTCTESCAAIENARHGCESLGTDIQSIREIDDSGCTLLSNNGNMLTNMIGSSILKSTDHTSQVKPGHLLDRFIPKRELHIDNLSESESEVGSDFEDDWESCASSVEEDEYFYDAVSLENSQDASYYSFPTRSLSSNYETNLSGLTMYCKHPSKSDQVPDLTEKANLTIKSQVPELNETHLVEGRKLSSMMEKETHVGSEQTDIGQSLLLDIDENQSEVHRRAEEIAISGLSQSNQCRLGKLRGEPGTPLPATKSDRQSQKAGLGNLSLNSPKIVTGNLLQDLDYYLECIPSLPLDEYGIWSSFLDILDFLRAEVDSLDNHVYDQKKKHQNSRKSYLDVAYSNVPNDNNRLLDQKYNSKKEQFDASNCNKPSGLTHSQTHIKIEQWCL